MSKYSKAKGRSNKATFVMLRYDLMDSPAWLSLSANAQALWLHIRRRYWGENNGDIPLSTREASKLLHVSPSTASRTFKELQEKGFIAVGEASSFDFKMKRATRWILTDERYNGKPPTNEWRSFKKS